MSWARNPSGVCLYRVWNVGWSMCAPFSNSRTASSGVSLRGRVVLLADGCRITPPSQFGPSCLLVGEPEVGQCPRVQLVPHPDFVVRLVHLPGDHDQAAEPLVELLLGPPEAEQHPVRLGGDE